MRNLSVGHNEDVSHPGGKLLHRSQGISQLIIVFKSTARDILISAKLQVFIIMNANYIVQNTDI